MSAHIDVQPLLSLAMHLCCGGVLVQSTEVLWNWRELGDQRLLGWSRPARARGRGLIHARPACIAVLVARAVAASWCMVATHAHPATFGVLGGLTLAQLYYNRRFLMLAGNYDTMFLVCLSALWIAALPGGSARLQTGALFFMAAQVSLAYVVAGWNKLVSPWWRSGARLRQIFKDSSYRISGVGAWLDRRPGWARMFSRAVIAVELLFPLCVFLPPGGFWIFIAAGALFHSAVAITMGLHGFWWSFVATYPALWYVRAHLA